MGAFDQILFRMNFFYPFGQFRFIYRVIQKCGLKLKLFDIMHITR